MSTWIEMIMFLFTFYLSWLYSVITHEFGHWIFRRYYGIQTHVFIGFGKRYIPIAPKWWFNPLVFGGVNYPASVLLLRNHPGVPLILRAGTWTQFIFSGLCIGILNYLPHTNLWYHEFVHQISLMLALFAVFSIPMNLKPSASSNRKRTRSLNTIKDWAEQGKRLSINDGMWIEIWHYLQHHPEDYDTLDHLESISKQVQVFNNYVKRTTI